MLMGIFDMEFLSVNDVMVPKNEIIGIDLNDDIETILKELKTLITPIYLVLRTQ